MQQMLDNTAGDETNLALKIEKKKQELERNKKRLRSLANVRYSILLCTSGRIVAFPLQQLWTTNTCNFYLYDLIS